MLNGWYLDEGTIVGKLEDIKKAVSIIRQDGPARGLFLSTEATSPVQKSTMWYPELDPSVLHPVGLGIPRIQEPGIVLLGSPVGDNNFVHTVIEKKIQAVHDITQLVPTLKDPTQNLSSYDPASPCPRPCSC